MIFGRPSGAWAASDGARARKTSDGSVDQCKQQIVTLLEGGEEAFRLRGQRYCFQP